MKASAVLDRDLDTVVRLTHAPKDRVPYDSAAEAFRQLGAESIVASFDPKHPFFTGRTIFGELIDQRQQGQFIGIGEEETAQTDGRLPEPSRRTNPSEPVGNRVATERFGDSAVPSLFAQTKRTNLRRQPFLEFEPSPSVEHVAPAGGAANGREAAWKNLSEP